MKNILFYFQKYLGIIKWNSRQIFSRQLNWGFNALAFREYQQNIFLSSFIPFSEIAVYLTRKLNKYVKYFRGSHKKCAKFWFVESEWGNSHTHAELFCRARVEGGREAGRWRKFMNKELAGRCSR